MVAMRDKLMRPESLCSKATDPMDLSKFIRHTFTHRELVDYVIEDSRGDAKYMLQKLLEIYGEKDVMIGEATLSLFINTGISLSDIQEARALLGL